MKLNRVVPTVAATILAWAGTSQALVVIDPFTTPVNVALSFSNPTPFDSADETDVGTFGPFDELRSGYSKGFFAPSGLAPWSTANSVTVGGGSATFTVSRTGNGSRAMYWAESSLSYTAVTSVNLTGQTLSFDVTASSQSGPWANNIAVYDNAGFVVYLNDGTTSYASVVGGIPNVLPVIGSYSIAFDNVNFPGINLAAVEYLQLNLYNGLEGTGAFSGSVTIQNLAIIPEPTTALMVSLAGAALVVFGRRRGARA